MSKHPVTIIGAGIGGVTLGRSLLKRGIPAVLYERAPSSPRNAYGITLHASSYRPLLQILDIEERAFRSRVAVDGGVGGNGAIDPKLLVNSQGVEASSFRAHRDKLERLIREGLDIKWEYAVEDVEKRRNAVALHLKNVPSIEREYIIGADGPHSNTRKSILQQDKLKVLPFVVFNGKRRVERSVFGALYAPAMKSSNVIETRKNGAVLHVSIVENAGDLVSISWIYSRAARGSADQCYKPNRPMSGATDIPEEFYHEVGALQDLDQPFKDVFDEGKLKTERVLTWLMRAVEIVLPEVQQLAQKRVFLMGDSVRAEAILGGQGANSAIKDGLELAEHIAANGGHPIADWYNDVYPKWQESLARGKAVIEKMHADRSVL